MFLRRGMRISFPQDNRRQWNHRTGLLRFTSSISTISATNSGLAPVPPVTKADIVDRIAEGTGLTKVETKAVVEGFMTTVQEAMEEGKRIELRGFGVFEVEHRAPRTGRNPQTNEPVHIEDRYEPVFRPSRQFREDVDASHQNDE